MITEDNPWLIGVSDFSITEPLMNAETIIGAGFDFIEPGLAKAVALPEKEFEAARKRIQENGIRVQSMNWFLPPDIKITGPQVDPARITDFLEVAFSRASSLGARAIVLGSPGSRNVPEGYPLDQALDQVAGFLNSCADVISANGYSLTIALEHVNFTETNILRLLSQTIKLAKLVDRQEIGVAIDFYHLAMEKEPLETILDAQDLAVAVQLADPANRSFPADPDTIPGLTRFFGMLRQIDYSGGVSVEANVTDLAGEGRQAVKALKQAIRDSAG